MDLRIFIEPQQGASYDDQLRVAKATEDGGFDAFFRSDHYLVMGNRDGLPGPTDSWTTLAGLARETSRIRLGTLVSSATFRYPGVLAIQVAQVDQMSGGRVELGLGAGWFEREHQAYGIPFPGVGERFDRLTEQLEILTGLWSTPVGQIFDYDGKCYQLSDSPALPKPAQQQIPVIIGGSGKKRTPALAARFAAEFNANFASIEETGALYERVRRACEDAGRSPDDLKYSVALAVACGRDDAELGKRAANIGRQVDELRESGLAGTPDEIVDKVGRYAEVGCQRIYLQVLDLDDIAHIELIASEVLPQL
ncbi:MAG TPA: LLM class F420-dependent oxidoreductase [Actinomycetales bacterium]|nr:LLM class F420-dependent oxidoreductase [Actinomycetales bacterium]